MSMYFPLLILFVSLEGTVLAGLEEGKGVNGALVPHMDQEIL